jgi:hypothetical protein
MRVEAEVGFVSAIGHSRPAGFGVLLLLHAA